MGPLRQRRSLRIVTAWIASFAILMAALMPSLMPSMSHSLAANSNAGSWEEICSTMGIKMVQVGSTSQPDSGTPSIPGKLALHAQHCPFCSLHAGMMGIPPSFRFNFLAASAASTFPSLFYQTPALQFIWSAAQSRAPPSIS